LLTQKLSEQPEIQALTVAYWGAHAPHAKRLNCLRNTATYPTPASCARIDLWLGMQGQSCARINLWLGMQGQSCARIDLWLGMQGQSCARIGHLRCKKPIHSQLAASPADKTVMQRLQRLSVERAQAKQRLQRLFVQTRRYMQRLQRPFVCADRPRKDSLARLVLQKVAANRHCARLQ